MPDGCYVYAILGSEATLPRDLRGIEDAAVSLVPFGALSAAVSHLSSRSIKPAAENVLRHEEVVEALSEASPALPVRFGTVLASTEAVKQALADRYAVLASDLERLGGKVELGLSVLWDEQDQASDDREEVVSSIPRTSGREYLRSRAAVYRRQEASRARAERLRRELESRLDMLVLDQRSTLLPTPRLAIRAAYLLDPPRIPDFRQVIDAVRAEHPNLRFLISGPWPPYTFVTTVNGKEPLANLLSIVQQRGGT